MILSIRTSLSLVAAALLPFFLSACSGSAEPLNYAWEANTPFAAFKGDAATQGKLVDHVLQSMSSTDPMTMFIASDTAFGLSRLDDAGFLYNAASIRARHDLARFPPVAKGGDSPGVYFGFLRENAGQVINPALVDTPASYIAVTKRLDTWDCAVDAGYRPPWEFGIPPADIDAATCAKQKSEHVSSMDDIAALLLIPEYVKALAINKHFNLTPNASADERAKNDAALATMRKIETEQHRKGFASFDD